MNFPLGIGTIAFRYSLELSRSITSKCKAYVKKNRFSCRIAYHGHSGAINSDRSCCTMYLLQRKYTIEFSINILTEFNEFSDNFFQK